MKKILWCLAVFSVITIVAYVAGPLNNKFSFTTLFFFLMTNSHWLIPLAIASLIFGFILNLLAVRENNLEWQEEFRDKKREERQRKGESEPYESYF